MQISYTKIRTKIKIFEKSLGGFTAAEGGVNTIIMMITILEPQFIGL